MHLHVLSNIFAILKQSPDKHLPATLQYENSFLSVTYTEEEVSIVCQERFIPADFQGEKEKGWRIVKVKGILDFSMTGILTALTIPLSEVNISVFVISTFNTDYLLIKQEALGDAVEIWKSQGHEITE